VTRAAVALADVIAHGLAEAGTRVVYGMPGGGNNLEVIGACERAGMRFVLVHGETAAAIMAGVDGELTNAPGACVVTRGPGIASAVNGVAQAMLDRQPMIVISDAVPLGERARVSHQRIDQDALLAPVTKWSASIGLDGAAGAIAAAVRIACEPPQGPVHLAFVPDAPRALPPAARGIARSGDLARARELLAVSRRPVLALGVGARHATPALRRLLEGAPWPVLTTYKAKGVVAERSEQFAGLLTGATIEAPVLDAADLIVGVGLDPVELIPAPWSYRAPLLSLGEWPIDDAYLAPEVALVGPLDELLALVGEHLRRGEPWSVDAGERSVRVPTVGLAPHEVVEAARELANARTIATVDAGAHMLVAMPLWHVDEPGEALISSGLATMGFALPAAIAAAIARPGRHVVCVIGDGGLGMCLAELETVARLDLPIVVVVFDDAALSLIRIKQSPEGHGGDPAVRFRDVDFAAIARAVGIPATRVEERGTLVEALRDAFARSGPSLIDAVVDPSGYASVLEAIRG
jgi:acetolactate synthase I/II/III large subunit